MKLSKAIEGYCFDRIAEGFSKATIESFRYSLGVLTRYLNDPEIESIKSTRYLLKSFENGIQLLVMVK